MTIVLAILGVIAAIVILPAFGFGAVAAIIDGLFKLLKGIFGVGFGCAKSCMSIIMIGVVIFLALLLTAKCN